MNPRITARNTYRTTLFFAALSVLTLSGAFVGQTTTYAVAAQPAKASSTSLKQGLDHIQSEYGRLKYQTSSDKDKIAGITALKNYADDLRKKNPAAIEPTIWYGLVLATEADFRNSNASLKLVEQARDVLKQTVDKDPHAMDAIALTSIGALYFQVPGWPVSFGNNKQAEAYLTQALKVAPNSIDANYFYGSYLVYRRQYAKAIPYFEKGLKAEPRKGLEIADRGRHGELQKALKSAQAYAKHENR